MGGGGKVYVNGQEMDMDDFQSQFGGFGGGGGKKSALNVFKQNEIRLLNEETIKDFEFRRSPWVVVFGSKENNEYKSQFESIIKVCKENIEIFECAYMNCDSNSQLCFN